MALDELAEHLRDLLGRLREDRLAVRALDRQAGVGNAVDRQRARLAEVADRVAHVLGSGRAVEADDVDPHPLGDRQHRLDVGAEQHLAAVRQQRDRDLDRDAAADPLEGVAGADDRGADLEDVLRRLDDDQVDATLDKAARLLVEDLDEAPEGDVAEGRIVGGGKKAGRADRARDEALGACRLAGDLGRLAVDLERVLAQPPLLELQSRALEGVRLDDLSAGFEHRVMDRLDHVGAVQHERLVALALQATVVLGGELHRLERRAHAAVVDDDAFAGGREYVPFFTHRVAFTSIGPGCRTVRRLLGAAAVAAASKVRVPRVLAIRGPERIFGGEHRPLWMVNPA